VQLQFVRPIERSEHRQIARRIVHDLPLGDFQQYAIGSDQTARERFIATP